MLCTGSNGNTGFYLATVSWDCIVAYSLYVFEWTYHVLPIVDALLYPRIIHTETMQLNKTVY